MHGFRLVICSNPALLSEWVKTQTQNTLAFTCLKSVFAIVVGDAESQEHNYVVNSFFIFFKIRSIRSIMIILYYHIHIQCSWDLRLDFL